jgi:hypothetical protein
VLKIRQRVKSAVIELFHEQESQSIVELVVLVADDQQTESADLLKRTEAARINQGLLVIVFPIIHYSVFNLIS